MKHKKPHPWNYLTCKDYVQAYDLFARQHLRTYSQRNFAKKGGVSSPNFLSLVISGKRKLQGEWLEGFIKAAQLDPLESQYLKLMSNLEHSSSAQERETLLSQILKLVESNSIKSLSLDQLQLLRKPLAWSLLYMIHLKDQRADPKWFKQRLKASFTVPEIRDALELLERLQLVELKEDGSYEAKERRLQTSDQIEKAQNYEFHKFVLGEGLQMLESLEPSERSFGSLTMAVPLSQIDEFKSEIGKFAKLLLVRYGGTHPTDGEVLRLNLQLYPLTKKLDH